MRFHRNRGARGTAEWVALADDQRMIFAYGRQILGMDITFHIGGADGWALGRLRWIGGPVPRSRNEQLHPEVARKHRERAFPRLERLTGWSTLRFERCPTRFTVEGREIASARAILLTPEGAKVWAPMFRPQAPA